MNKLIKVTPYPIKGIQTDNGSEFLDKFDTVAKDAGIVHFFTYPSCPKQNSHVERFNRTLQEDFVEDHREFLEEKDTTTFNNYLIDHLLWYNTEKPHYSLGQIPPMEKVVQFLKESNMYATHT